MKIAICALTQRLDRLGGYFFRLKTLIRGLANLGNEVIVIQSDWAHQHSSLFFNSVKNLPVSSSIIESSFLDMRYYRFGFPAFWIIPIGKYLPKSIDVLDSHDPIVRIPVNRSFRAIFSHNHFNPYIYKHLSRCGYRSMPMLFEIPLLDKMLKSYQKKVDGYITQTGFQRRWMIDKYEIPASAVTAIPPGYDSEHIHENCILAKKSTHGTFVISYTGRLHTWKGVFELLEAFAQLSSNYPTWNLQYIGVGPALPDLKKLVNRERLQERVKFLGQMEHSRTLELVAKSDIFVFPSYIETFGMSLLEAMALGVPSIATRLEGIREYMIEDGKTGILIPLKDPTALYHALIRLISDIKFRTYLGFNGRRHTQNLTNDRMIRSTLSFYKYGLQTPTKMVEGFSTHAT